MDTREDEPTELRTHPTVSSHVSQPGHDATEFEERLAEGIRARLFPGLGPTRDRSERAPPGGPGPAAPARIGRYAVLRELGRGGMGVVFACYDEQLERKVALKLLRARYHEALARRRLEREGQALARLSHPNVVQIYELGEHHGQVFVAMEFVVGQTLRAWMSAADRNVAHPWRQTLAILRQAGAGLEAAHAAGLVHRDFKPDNVIVGDDGRVRVLDFGLVRHASTAADSSGAVTAVGDVDELGESVPEPDLGLDDSRPHTLTRPGTVMGTPAYMAPEQLEMRPCDAASDQFSFCVVAFEGLFGRRPHAGDTLTSLSASVPGEDLVPVDERSTRVPKRLREVILRGLSADPAARWPNMSTLLAELDRVLDPRPRARAWALALAAVVVGSGAVALSGSFERPQLCAFDDSALVGIWDDERRRALRAAFEARGREHSERSLETIDTTLTSWGQSWLDGQRKACEATHVHGTQSDKMLDLRSGCLERQRREAAAITTLLTSADGAGVGHAFEVLAQLPDLSVCDDPRLAETSHPLPRDATRRDAILTTHAQVARARALARAGHLDQAEALAEQLAARAASFDYLPLTLELRSLTAERSLWRRRTQQGVDGLRKVIADAEIAGLDELSATSRTKLASHVVGQWGHSSLQAQVLEEAETAVARLGRPGDRRHARLRHARAAWLEDRGDYEAASAAYRANIEDARAREDLEGIASAQRQLARLLAQLGRYDAAEQAYDESRASFARARGPSSVVDASIELDLGLVDLARGSFDAAAAHYALARELYAPLVDPNSTTMSVLELAEAKLAFIRGDLEGASRTFAGVIEIGADDVALAEAWQALGVIRYYQDDLPGSLDAYRRSRVFHLAAYGPAHPSLGLLASNIGESLAAAGDHDAALAAYADAIAKLEAALPRDHPDLALPYKARAQSRLEQGQRASARLDLERALQIHERHPGEPVERADVEFTLARLSMEEGERERALALAESAKRRLLELGHHAAAARISAWLDDHD